MKLLFHTLTRTVGLLWLAALPYLLPAQNARLVFTAHLEGSQEVPPLAVPAQGLATITLSEDLKTMYIHSVLSGLTGPATAAHLHVGPPGVSGPVLLGLNDLLIGGNRLLGQKPLSKTLLRQILAGQIYLNVHTMANPGGEMRGQLRAESDKYFAFKANGQHEVPPVTTSALAVGTVEYTLGEDAVRVQVTATGLSGPITAAHIHQGAEGVVGPVVAPLTVNGTQVTGNIALTSLPAGFLQKVDSGQFYINIHTMANPGGEIRGQLRRSASFSGVATLNGAQENPPVITAATGTGWLTMNSTFDSVTYAVLATGLTPTAAHVHRGVRGMNGPVLLPLQATMVPGFFMSTAVAVDSTLLLDLIANRLYFNVHTATNPGGEIRGQIETSLRTTLGFDLCGAQEVPPNNSSGIGAGLVSVDRTRTSLRYAVIVDDLSSNVVAAHIHKGVVGTNGPVLFGINLPQPYAEDVTPIADSIGVFLNNNLLYMNVHTTNFPGGEVRGQVRDAIVCPAVSGVDDPTVQALQIFPNPVQSELNVRFDSRESFQGRLRLATLTGQVVLEQVMYISSGEQAWTLPLPALPPGVYFFTLQQQDRLLFHHKVVKM